MANIGFLDVFWQRESEAMDRLFIGTRGGAGFAGLRDSLT